MEKHHLVAVLREYLEDLVRCQEEDGARADVVTGEGLHHGEAALPGDLAAGEILAGALGDQHDGGRVPDTQLVTVSRSGDRKSGGNQKKILFENNRKKNNLTTFANILREKYYLHIVSL